MFVQTIQSFIWVQTLRRQITPRYFGAQHCKRRIPFVSFLRGGLFLPQYAVNHVFVGGGVSPKFA